MACTKRGAISSPLPEVMSKPPIFVVLPPMSMPTTIFLLICFAFLFGEFGGETADAAACRDVYKRQTLYTMREGKINEGGKNKIKKEDNFVTYLI